MRDTGRFPGAWAAPAFLFLFPCISLTISLAISGGGAMAAADTPELSFEKYTLPNGLQVILHRDSTTPMVAVNVWYHVGAKDEKPGRTGFAHLFEHMMFQGSQHHDDDYFLPLQKIGGAVNGSTDKDRTNYWETVPADQLELALWLEADRMGYLLPAMTQERLDNQRDVVKNEKRQGENEPYARSEELLLKLMYPQGHPYSWTVIGSMEDLSAATKEDVSEFFRQYYVPNNASLCVAGDFDPEQAKAWIARYFAPIPPGRPLDRVTGWTPAIDGERRAVAQDAVRLPRLYMSWHSPGYYQPGDAECDLLADILATGKNSRLYRALVYEQQIAQSVTVRQESRQLGGTFTITVTAAPGCGLPEIETAVDRELQRLLKGGVDARELESAQLRTEAAFVRGLERIGGFGGKADRLNRYNFYTGDPGYLTRDLQRYREATAASVAVWARRCLRFDNRAVLHILPQGDLAAEPQEADMSAVPGSSGATPFSPPAVRQGELSNGLDVFVVENHSLPLVEAHLTVLSGWSSDPHGRPGTAALTAAMLDEGAGGKDALEISAAADELGARLQTTSSFDGSTVAINVLKAKLPQGLALVRDLALSPDFPAEEFSRVRKLYLGRQRQEESQPNSLGIKELQKRVYGADHPYAQPYTGSGTEASLQALAPQDLRAFHRTWYTPDNAALVLAGDVVFEEVMPVLERTFGNWRGSCPARSPAPPAAPAPGPRVVLIDRPGAQQSTIVGGLVTIPRGDPDHRVLQVVNTAFGGQFASRINLNLREDKGYTYGARSLLLGFRDSGLFLVTAPVHTQYTAESLAALIGEMQDLCAGRPVAGAELDDSRNRLVMGFPADFQTQGMVADGVDRLLASGLSVDEWRTFAAVIGQVGEAQAARAASRCLDPGRMVWVVVGDREVIESGLQGLGLGEIEVVGQDP